MATWNLEKLKTLSERAVRQNRRISEVDADIWILTETVAGRAPGDGFVGLDCGPMPGVPETDTVLRKVAIWSCTELVPVEGMAPHPRGSVAGITRIADREVIVYGSVLAYANEKRNPHAIGDADAVETPPQRKWEVHKSEIARQSAEWKALIDRFPDHPIIVAGDFNQARAGGQTPPDAYGNPKVRQLLSDGLAVAGLTCHTEANLVAAGQITKRQHVDHICTSRHFEPVGDVIGCDRVDDQQRKLSDHATIAIDLMPRR